MNSARRAWCPLPIKGWKGLFDKAGLDPMIAHAVATDFRDLTRQRTTPAELPVLLQLSPCHDVGDLRRLNPAGWQVPPAYPDQARVCSAAVSLAALKSWFAQNEPAIVAHVELQMPVIPARPRPDAARVDRPSPSKALESCGSRTLVGVIDWGCPFAHRSFRRGNHGQTRILRLWVQDGAIQAGKHATTPSDFAYGVQLDRKTMNRVMRRHRRHGIVDEAACYRSLRYDAGFAQSTHGAAVLGLLAGPVPLSARSAATPDHPPTWAVANDRASRADIAFVQLPRDVLQDSSSAGLMRHVLDGVRYIIACAGPQTRHIVINLSDGSSRGPHDGSALIDQGLQEMIRESLSRGIHLEIVIAAGNSFDSRRHAVLGTGQPQENNLEIDDPGVTLRLPPGSEVPNFITVRMPPRPSAAPIQLQIRPPGIEEFSPALGPGQAMCWPDDRHPSCTVVFPHPDPDGPGMALITLAATASTDPLSPQATVGDWAVRAVCAQSTGEAAQLWISRAARNDGALPRSEQARFVDVDGLYDPSRFLRPMRDDPVNPSSPLRRRGTLNALATMSSVQGSTCVWVAADHYRRNGVPSFHASAGPSAGPGARRGPDFAAPTHESLWQTGVRSAGTLTGHTARMSGTSFSAPQVSRALIDQWPPLKTPGHPRLAVMPNTAVPGRVEIGNLMPDPRGTE